MEVKEASAGYLVMADRRVPVGYKQTEVGALPEDWETVPMCSLGTFSKGQGIRKDEAASGDIPCVRYGEIYTYHNDIIRAFNSRISADVAKTSKRLKKGDLLFAGSGETKEEIGKCVAFVGDEEAYVGGDIVILSPNKGVSTFFGYLFNAPVVVRQKASKGQGDAVVHISASALSSIKLPLPPTKAEQEAIAEALSDADALIESLEQLLAKKRHLKQGAMQQLLTGKKRLPGFSGEWEVKRLGELAKIQRGASPRPIDSPIWFDENSSVGWVRISDVTSSGMHLNETTQRLSPLGVQNSRPVSRGSLIMSICATVGRPVITGIDVCIHDGFVVFDNLRCAKHFLYYVLKFIESDWSRHGQTGSQMNLNTGLINRTEVSLPPNTDEQTAIATILSDMDAEIATLEAKFTKARNLKQGMMQELLTGRIRLVRPSSNVVQLPVKKEAGLTSKSHNWQINEAVVISILAKHFGSERWPLGRKRYTKLSYLLHRQVERQAEGYLKKAAGPYNPETKYKGPEAIALKNRYVRLHSREKFSGFIAAEKIGEAEIYFSKWYGEDILTWLEQFRYKSNDELEVLATVDMAIEELRRDGKAVKLGSVKQVIQDHPEWKFKLDRAIFSDDNIDLAIQSCRQLFASVESDG